MNNRSLVFLLVGFLVSLLAACTTSATNSVNQPAQPQLRVLNPNQTLLPENYQVYVLGKTVLNHPAPGPYPGFQPKILPTKNFYTGYPGCYIICYSHDAAHGIYPISKTIYVNGQVRVPGHYQGRVCQPSGYVHKDISKAQALKFLCQQSISSCQGLSCWAGGDTGGWFGIAPRNVKRK